ncbi:MAG TPA: DCC1-like thiol-disulfide oxidoreductase family protein, partial [Thermoanaerobaculia bacterium]|nr:DCC1-like thiol-disulfide oxidoreductase family protein [Thermoanaerobaculia bacterium]
MFKKREADMEKLTVLYDASCGFCVSCRRWMDAQPAYFPIEFLPAGTAAAAEAFPDLANEEAPAELVAVDSDGAVYRDAHAWIMCLYALREYREWAQFLSRPALLPLARQAFEMLSRNRKEISDKLGLLPEPELAARLRRIPVRCEKTGAVPDPTPSRDRRAGLGTFLALLLILLGGLVWERGPQIRSALEDQGRPLLSGIFRFDTVRPVLNVLATAQQQSGPMSRKEAPMEYILWTYGVYLVIS